MVTAQGPKVLEFNVRMGDPETQPLLVRLESDIVPLLEAVIDGTLDEQELRWDERAAVCVVMASGGYPDDYQKGKVISGIKQAEKSGHVKVFQAGTTIENGQLVTSGGRVLGVTALADTIAQAQKAAYDAAKLINFDGAYYRRDIAAKALR